MATSDAPVSPLQGLDSSRQTRSERRPGYWHKIFRIRKKEKEAVCDLEGNVEASDSKHTISENDFNKNKKRGVSLRKTRSRKPAASTPKSARFFTFTNRTPRTRMSKKTNLNDESSEQEYVENRNAEIRLNISSPSPSSIIQKDQNAESLLFAQRKRVSLHAIRFTKGNSTMLFGKRNSLSMPLTKNKSETRDDLWFNSVASVEEQPAQGLKTRSLLDIGELPSVKAQRFSSLLLDDSGDVFVQSNKCGHGGSESAVNSTDNDDTSTLGDSFDNTPPGGNRMFSFRGLFRDPLHRVHSAKSRHFSVGSHGFKSLLKPDEDGFNRFVRRSSSFPQISRQEGRIEKASDSRNKKVASFDDGLQCPWGVKADTEDKPLSPKQNIPLTVRIADISSALNFTGRRGICSRSGSINLSDGDCEERNSENLGMENATVEMQEDDFIEYTVKMAKKQRK